MSKPDIYKDPLMIEFLSISGHVMSRERVHNMRRRLNPHHSEEDKAYEKMMFNQVQQNDWQELKNMYCDNNDYFLKLLNSPDVKPDHKKTIEAISLVIEKEIDELLLLGDEHED